jgi:hypothetical protein
MPLEIGHEGAVIANKNYMQEKNLIKKLKHLSNLINGIPYDWNLEIPRTNKGEYLRETIKSFR